MSRVTMGWSGYYGDEPWSPCVRCGELACLNMLMEDDLWEKLSGWASHFSERPEDGQEVAVEDVIQKSKLDEVLCLACINERAAELGWAIRWARFPDGRRLIGTVIAATRTAADLNAKKALKRSKR
jgi:hypothetical protein